MIKRGLFAFIILTIICIPFTYSETLFKSGFEEPVKMSDWIKAKNWRKETTGADQGYDWETDFINTDSYWNVILNSETYPNPDECIGLDITSDEAHSGSRSLYMKVFKQCKYNSVQARVAHLLGHYPYEEAHIKYWLKFPDDIESRFSGDGVLLNEVRLSDFRIAFEVTSAKGPLQFRAWAEPTSSGWDPLWIITSDEEVPVGEWFHVELYTHWKTHKEGGGAYWVKINGKKIIEVIPTPTRRICGSSADSQTCSLPYNWNMIKLYTYTDNIEAWLDDFELYDTYTPEDAEPTYECNDGIDNDGDSAVDTDDSGCSADSDDDESDCGDGACEGGEECDSCISDCGACQTDAFLPETLIEAEDGTFADPMKTGTDSLASGSSYIYTSTQHQGSSTYAFDISELGKYIIEARIIAETVGDDSFYVGLDGEPAQGDDTYAWDTIEISSWTWVNVSKRGPDGNHTYAEFNPMIWNLSSGMHTFTFYGRETDTRLDQLILRKYAAPQCGFADKDNDNVVEIDELISYINNWKSGNVDISDLMQAIGFWKKGCYSKIFI